MANYNFVDLITSDILSYPEVETFGENFDSTGYDSTFTMQILTTDIVIFALTILQIILFSIMKHFKHKVKNKRVKGCFTKVYNSFKSILFRGGLIRFFYETYLELTIACLIGLVSMSPGDTLGSTLVLLSQLFTLFLASILTAYLVFIVILHSFMYDKFDDEKFNKRYGTLTDSLNIGDPQMSENLKRVIYLYPVFVLLKRLILAFIWVLLRDHLALQLLVFYLVTIFMIIYLFTVQPMETAKMNMIELFNELISLLVSYSIIVFSPILKDNQVKYDLGKIYIILQICAFAFHWLCNLHDDSIKLKKFIKLKLVQYPNWRIKYSKFVRCIRRVKERLMACFDERPSSGELAKVGKQEFFFYNMDEIGKVNEDNRIMSYRITMPGRPEKLIEKLRSLTRKQR